MNRVRIRSRIWGAAIGLGLWLGLGVAHALPPTRTPSVTRPTTDELEHALARRDSVELERLGARFGAVRLAALVERGSPGARKAALAALEVTEGSLAFVPRLVSLADRADADPATAAAITASVRRICERVPRGELNLDELPPDLPRAAVDALAALAGRDERAVALRVDAVAALAALVSLAPSASQKLTAMSATRDADVRRAVADALPAQTAAPVLARMLAEDAAPTVALAAADSLCRDIPPPGTEKKADKTLERASLLSVPSRARLRQLAVDTTLDENERLDVLPCLRAGAQRAEEQHADAEVLRTLGRGADGPLKKRARAYGPR
jgi:hypothetical protein